MRKWFLLSVLVNCVCVPLVFFGLYKKVVQARQSKSTSLLTLPGWYYKYSQYWQQKKSLYDVMPVQENGDLFVGDSLTDLCDWNELFPGRLAINRGIEGDTSDGLLTRIGQVTKLRARNIFMMIGTNDLALKFPQNSIIGNINQIIDSIQRDSPQSKIYLLSVLPKGANCSEYKKIPALNARIKQIADSRGLTYIDLYPFFLDKLGFMDKQLSNDGTHINGEGYLIWKKQIEKYVE